MSSVITKNDLMLTSNAMFFNIYLPCPDDKLVLGIILRLAFNKGDCRFHKKFWSVTIVVSKRTLRLAPANVIWIIADEIVTILLRTNGIICVQMKVSHMPKITYMRQQSSIVPLP